MDLVFNRITKEDQEILDKIGLKPYEHKRLNPFFCPNQPHYWAASAFSMAFLHYIRMKMCVTRGSKFFLSILMVGIPILGISDHRIMIDNTHRRSRHSLKLQLLFEPEVREALETSVRINDEYQNALREEIERLKLL